MDKQTERSASGRVSMLIELRDEPGSLESALHVFSANGVNLTHIESRPAEGQFIDFFVDCEGERGMSALESVITTFQQRGVTMMVLDDKQVPWFPRHISELDQIAQHTLDAGSDLQSDHPGFSDKLYRQRRAMIDGLARQYRHGDEIPLVAYTESEEKTWKEVYSTLRTLHEQYACEEYQRIIKQMEVAGLLSANEIPQSRDISGFLYSATGFSIRPVAGLLTSRDFLAGLAFRVFFSTQYMRHDSVPLYTPEPDLCHELIGHAPMFADAAFADLSQEIGLASLGASDEEIERLARCYWFSIEFGLLWEDNRLKAYGAGLLSSFGELQYACNADQGSDWHSETRPWEPEHAASQSFPITEYQQVYYTASSLRAAKAQMHEHCQTLPRPFYARFSPATQSIWVDRAIKLKR